MPDGQLCHRENCIERGSMVSNSVIEKGALRIYGALLAQREQWGGSLVLCCGDLSLSAAMPAVVSVAGGTSLVIGASAASIKAAQRDGGLDFVVNSLDEALRTLKNSIRERRSLSVGLTAEPRPVFGEMFERGVLPDFATIDDTLGADVLAEVERLREQGTRIFDLTTIDREETKIDVWLRSKGWSETGASRLEGPALREWNAKLLRLLPENDEVRRRWVRLMPLYFRGALNGVRHIWLSEEEQRILGDIPDA